MYTLYTRVNKVKIQPLNIRSQVRQMLTDFLNSFTAGLNTTFDILHRTSKVSPPYLSPPVSPLSLLTKLATKH